MTLELIHDYELADDERGLIAKLSGRCKNTPGRTRLSGLTMRAKTPSKI